MSKLRDLYDRITPKWKATNPGVTAWLNEATTEIDGLIVNSNQDAVEITSLKTRMTSLEGRVTALEHPVTPPPTGSEGRVQFCMYATSQADPYDLAPPPTLGQEAWMRQHWNRMITYVPNIQAWHPGCWRYLDWLAIYVNSQTANAHPEWILRDASGTKLTFFAPNQYLADIGNPAYVDYMIATAGTYLSGGARGLHIDDVDLDRVVVPTAINPRTPGVPYTLHDWDHDMSVGLQKLRAAYPAAQIVHNSLWWEDTSNPDVLAALKACDVFELERGFNDPNYTPAKIQQVWSFCDLAHSLGTAVNHLSESNGGTQAAHFNLGCALLCSGGKDFAYENTGWQPNNWDPIYDKDYGAALGGRAQVSANVWERRFAGGTVTVDLAAKTAVLP